MLVGLVDKDSTVEKPKFREKNTNTSFIKVMIKWETKFKKWVVRDREGE